jgi:hypothetical protein
MTQPQQQDTANTAAGLNPNRLRYNAHNVTVTPNTYAHARGHISRHTMQTPARTLLRLRTSYSFSYSLLRCGRLVVIAPRQLPRNIESFKEDTERLAIIPPKNNNSSNSNCKRNNEECKEI